MKKQLFISVLGVMNVLHLNGMELVTDTNNRISTQWFTLSYPVPELVIANDTGKSILVASATKQYFLYHTIKNFNSWYFKKPYNKRKKNQTNLTLTINHGESYDGTYSVSYDSPRSACKESLKELSVSKLVAALQSNDVTVLPQNKRRYLIGDISIVYDPKSKKEDVFKKSTHLLRKRSQSF